MVAQEHLPGLGLNGLFWEERRWVADDHGNVERRLDGEAASTTEMEQRRQCYYYAPALGELRLERPPGEYDTSLRRAAAG